MVMSSQCYRRHHQQGMALILIAFIVGLGASAMMYKMFNASSLQDQQDEKTMQVLSEAKSALIAWAVSHPNSPGMMPWPDRNTDLDFDGDSAYDGKSDCVTSSFQSSYLLGQLPWRAQSNPCVTPHTGLGADYRDAQGNRLWYAVSRNLVRDYENSEYPVINPGMANPPHAVTPYLRQGGTDSYPWLRVLDRNGNLVSDRVAAVIISPGSPLEGQDRSSAAPDASQYLDTFRIGAAIFSNRGYATADEDFIMGEDSRKLSATDATYARPYHFNDKLVYITIDELIEALEKRVGEVVRSSLKNYHDTNGYYPYAAHLGTVLSYVSDGNLLSGFLPIFQSCTYNAISTTNRSFSCNKPIFNSFISGITTVRFYLPSGTFTSSTGSCTRQNTNTRCYCTGVGTCSNASLIFSCNEMSCSALGTGATGSLRIRDGKLTFASGGCTINTPVARDSLDCPVSNTNTSRATCSNSNGTLASYSNGDVALDGYLPGWFKDNRWQEYVFYHLTRPESVLSVGAKNTESVIITVGRSINSAPFALSKSPPASQVRPSCNSLNNYLDSVENSDEDGVYDATSKLRNANYNDQTFVVAP